MRIGPFLLPCQELREFAFSFAVLAGLTLVPVAAAVADQCSIGRYFETTMTPDANYTPIISVAIDGQPRKFLLDTGGFWSLVSPDIVTAYKPRTAAISSRLGLQGLTLDKSVKIQDLGFGNVLFHGIEFYIAPSDYGLYDGTLGANWLQNFDVEIDPVKNIVAFFSHDHCDDQAAYWPHQDLAIVPFDTDRISHDIVIPVTLADKELRGFVDTGSTESVLSMRAAKRYFDLTPESPGMEKSGSSIDGSGRAHPIYRYQFSTLQMGSVTFKNTWILIADMEDMRHDIILGMHQLHGLHLFVAYKERKLYISSARGDIAARTAAGEQLAAPGTQVSDPQSRIVARNFHQQAVSALRKKDLDQALALIGQALKADPTYSDGYVALADIHAAKGQLGLTQKDFEDALRTNPANVSAYTNRARLEALSGDSVHARADVDAALKLDANFIDAYELRASLEVRTNERDRAFADAAEIIRIAPASTRSYEFRAGLYSSAGDYAHAYDDESSALKLSPKSAHILNNRCWYGAILGRLDEALEDCNAAIDIASDSAAALDSRAYVRLRKGQFDRALKDYDAALKAQSDMPSSLYGRGLTKRQMGDQAGGDADIAAAEKADPKIAEHFGK